MKEFHRELPCELTDDEVAQRAERMAKAIEAKDAREAKAKEVAKAYKRQVDELAAEVRLLADAVRTRVEMRDVLCVVKVQRDGSALVVRTDTGDVIEVHNAGPGTQAPLWHDETAETEDEKEWPDDSSLPESVEDAEYDYVTEHDSDDGTEPRQEP